MFLNRKFNRQDGFSMMELLVSLVTMTVVVGASLALIGSSIKFAHSTYNMTDAEQGLRTAHEMINRDLVTAGDGMKGIGKITTPVAFVQNYLTRTPVLNGSDTTHGDVGLVTSDDNIPANIAVPQASSAVNFQTGSDRISMLVKDTSFPDVSVAAAKISQVGSNTNIVVLSGDINKFQVGEIYAIVSQDATLGLVSAVNTTTFTVTLTSGDAYSINQTGVTSPIYTVAQLDPTTLISTQAVAIVRLQIIQYYVEASGLLHRRVFGIKGAGFADSIVAEHVTNLQFRYMTNISDANGFVKQPIRVITSAEQTAVREIETNISVETVRAVNATTNGNANSGRQSISQTTATTVRNLQFRQALSP